jgi:hypothetical protein
VTWERGERVQVSLPFGEDGMSVHLATVARVQDDRVMVIFDEPLMYGGLGYAWVSSKVLALPGQSPKPPERNLIIG